MKSHTILALLLAFTSLCTAHSLRDQALEHGLKPVPKDLKSLRRSLEAQGAFLSKEKILLGQTLFHEKKLSLNGDLSCASCHNLDKGGIDGKQTAIGYSGQSNPYHLNTPTVLNTALSTSFFWNGRSPSLEDQAKGPMIASFEMASSPLLIENRLNAIPSYRRAFHAAFGRGKITFKQVAEAIGAYERTLITRGRFDAYLDGDDAALTSEEQAGLRLFLTKGCVACHDGMGLGGRALRKFPIVRHPVWSIATPDTLKAARKAYERFLESDSKHPTTDPKALLATRLGKEHMQIIRDGYFDAFSNDEAYAVMAKDGCYRCHEKHTFRISKQTLQTAAYPFENRGNFLGEERKSRYFRVPLLRNIASTAPYFHNGGIEKLEAAIRIMLKHQVRSKVNEQEVRSIAAFLQAVDGERVYYRFD